MKVGKRCFWQNENAKMRCDSQSESSLLTLMMVTVLSFAYCWSNVTSSQKS